MQGFHGDKLQLKRTACHDSSTGRSRVLGKGIAGFRDTRVAREVLLS